MYNARTFCKADVDAIPGDKCRRRRGGGRVQEKAVTFADSTECKKGSTSISARVRLASLTVHLTVNL